MCAQAREHDLRFCRNIVTFEVEPKDRPDETLAMGPGGGADVAVGLRPSCAGCDSFYSGGAEGADGVGVFQGWGRLGDRDGSPFVQCRGRPEREVVSRPGDVPVQHRHQRSGKAGVSPVRGGGAGGDREGE